ncbi:SDR family oxidoreductase [Leifsonia shinshuensis]|uniref:NAD(P)H dehydrogenase (Quinone) n=1 Tax=Leifsonia shinshuensis TaxID=150026 RepID=A0A853CT42_9MICO|nr:SDR family oxidoreductase [Leifsonia shinshuensis]NYJ23522.1 NAD(P)H dehydrogenase (quinone) [Leifsonia shinshuensis]
MTIVVTGATGHLGRLTVDALLDRGVPASDIRALGRSAERLAPLAERGVQTAVIDFEKPETLDTAFAGADALLLVSGSEVGQRIPQHRNAIDAAVRAGVGRLVYTSAPHADDTDLILAPEHAETERLLANSGLPVTVLRNNWYTENYVGQVDAAAATGELVGSAADGRVASASRKDYAEAAAVVLTTDGHDGAVYELAGDVAWTFDDLAAAVGELLGTPVVYRSVTPEEHGSALREAGLDEGTAGFVVALDGNIRDGALADAPGTLAELIGRPTTPLAAGLAEARAAAESPAA